MKNNYSEGPERLVTLFVAIFLCSLRKRRVVQIHSYVWEQSSSVC